MWKWIIYYYLISLLICSRHQRSIFTLFGSGMQHLSTEHETDSRSSIAKMQLDLCKFKESQTKVVFVFTQNTLYDRRRRESSNSIQKAAAHDKTQTADVWTFNRTFVEDTVWRTNSPHDSWRTANKHCSVCVCVSWHKQTPQLCDDRKIVVKYLLLNPVDQPPFRWRCF